MKEPQPGTCFAFPTPELAKYSSASSRCYSRKRHRSSWPFGRTGLGQERTHNPGSPGDGRASHVEGGRSPPVSSALLPGAPLGRTGRATRPGRRRPLSPHLHAEGGRSLPVSSPGSPPRTSHAGGGRPPSPRPAPLRPLSPPCSPRRQERAGAWRRAPSRENTAASVSSSPSRKADSRTQREYPESPKFDTELHHPSRVIYLIF